MDKKEIVDIKLEIKNNFITKSNGINPNTFKMLETRLHIKNYVFNSTIFLNDLNPTLPQRIWHILNDFLEIKKCTRGNIVTFETFKKGYSICCPDNKCKCRLDLYQNPEFKNKLTTTYINKYGVKHSSLNKNVKEKQNNTNIRKYGAKCALQNPIVNEKARQTFFEKYGKHYTFEVPHLYKKHKQTMIKRYGVEYTFLNKELLEKVKVTNIEKYGNQYPSKTKEIKEKTKQRSVLKYGTSFPSQRHINSLVPLIESSDFWKQFNSYQEIKDYFKNKVVDSTIICYAKKYRPDLNRITLVSEPHKLINNFLDSLNIEYKINDRTQISPIELDIYIPEYKLAIEINGIYWHSEQNGVNSDYHLNKLQKCEEKGIDLIHLFDIDILNKTNIVFSLIKQKLSLNKIVDLSLCSVIDLDRKTAIDFIKDNSLFEYTESNIHKGLIYQNELVSVINLRKLNNEFDYDLIQTNKIDYNIFDWFFKIKLKKSKVITTYVHRNVYNKNMYNTWTLHSVSTPKYYFTKDWNKIIHIINFDKSLLIEYNSELPIYENLIKNDYFIIWDCGFKVYRYK